MLLRRRRRLVVPKGRRVDYGRYGFDGMATVEDWPHGMVRLLRPDSSPAKDGASSFFLQRRSLFSIAIRLATRPSSSSLDLPQTATLLVWIL
ncbi:hypothetical protein LR48_Vigan07g235100 [Vigna angularis]|uniref:Uncharacterized protein n=1 Tax=Phaseolus angularis TaxID=3914 RepID=A0A0L9V1B7_PHAAN|nr:hypothetical protein LR48_Vigan07g235100 [Vigna angularis]